ncbi:MAG: hypothetical protein KF809_04365 [Chloroflexi bacterium]|nr:hypothetical protein [Chloroflexota bacterium]
MALRDGDPIWFYELHEGDDDLFADVLLAHDLEYDEQELLDLVLEARSAVLAHYTEDTLSEAVANELARRHGFLVVDDTQLRAAITVSANEGETAVAPVDEAGGGQALADEYRSLLVDIDKEDRRWGPD